MSATQQALTLKMRARDILIVIRNEGSELDKDKRIAYYREYNNIRFQIIRLIYNFKNKKMYLIPALNRKDFLLGTCQIQLTDLPKHEEMK